MKNEDMKKFDFYEFAGILSPGAIAIFGISKLHPDLGLILSGEKLGLGDLGIFVILSYVAGHLLQAFGNVIERVWWFLWRGMPTDWIRSGQRELLAKTQLANLPIKLKDILQINCDSGISGLGKRDWYSITRQIYSAVQFSGRAERIDIFNGTYGMFRGIAASLLVIVAAALLELGGDHRKLYCLLTVGIILSLLRMHRFGVHYARELFVQFLNTSKDDKARPKKEEEPA